MHYLVTGGCGFIGSHLVEKLVRLYHQVTVLDDLSAGAAEVLPTGVNFIKGDILDRPLVDSLLTEAKDGCFHMAAIPSVARCLNEWSDISRVNVLGSINIFEACAQANDNPVPVVYASSAAVYGALDGILEEGETNLQPASSYGVDKLACEYYAHIAWQNYQLPNTGLRFFNVYGPGQSKESPYSGVITCFMNAHEQGAPFTINGSGKQTRDFIYVGDVADTCIAAMQQKNMQHEIINVCTGKATSVLDIAHAMAAIYGTDATLKFRDPVIGDVMHSLGSTARLKQSLPKLQAFTSLDDGLKQTLRA